MKMKPRKSYYRLSQYVLLTVLAVIIVISAISFGAFYYAMKAETNVRYIGMKNVVSEKIAKTIRGMEMNAKNVFDEVGKHMDSPEAVIEALKSKTSLNPDVRGYFAAFVPDYFQQKGRWFEPYVHHQDSSSFEVSQVGSARHDYTKSEWYIRAEKTGESFWSDPYYYQDDPSVASGHYCTFVKPVHNTTGQLVCVCGADMTLEWLTKELQLIDDEMRNDRLLNAYRIYRDLDFYTVIINNDGTCIAHPKGEMVPIKDKDVISDMAQKQSGKVEMTINGVPSMVYYGPIDYINWSVAIVVPKQDLQKPLLVTGLILLSVAVLGMMVVWLVCRRVRNAEMAS